MISALLLLATHVSHPAPKKSEAPVLIDSAGLTWRGLIVLSSVDEHLPKPDPFAASKPKSKYDGTPFGFKFAFVHEGENDDQSFGASWSYDASAGLLHLVYTPEPFAGGRGAELRTTSKRSGSYVSHTAMGVKARVTAYVATSQGALFENEPFVLDHSWSTRPSYELELKATPDEGRQLTTGLSVFVTGVVAAGEDGKVAHCDDDRAGATLDDPTEVLTRTCKVSVRVERVSFYSSSRTGPLKVWGRGATGE